MLPGTLRLAFPRLFLAIAAVSFSLSAIMPGLNAQAPKPVTMIRLYTGADGLSHFETVEVPITAESGTESSPLKMGDSFIVRVPAGYFEDWHNADERRYVVPISGKAEIEVSGGGKFTVEPGQICLAEDLTGKGHTFRVVSDQQFVGLFVNFAK
jgi:hypothetical protein